MPVSIPSQVTISPVFQDTVFLGNNGLPLAGGKIFSYEAGSNSVEQTTFTTANGNIANTNPIVLDASGRLTTGLWLADGFAYNLVLTQTDGTTVLQTHDNIRGVIGSYAGGGIGTVMWNPITVVPTYVSSTIFQLAGDYTNEFVVGNRVRYQFNDLTFGYGIVSALAFTTGLTQVTLVVDSVPYSSVVINVAWSSAVVNNYVVDAGAVGYTPTFTYAGLNVGTQIQAATTSINAHATSVYGNLSGSTYIVTTPVGYASYIGMSLDVIFDFNGGSSINVDGIGVIALKQFDQYGALVSPPVMTSQYTTRIMYNGVDMVVTTNLPYLVPPPVPVSFAPTMGTVNAGGTFTVTAGGSGKIAVTVSNYAHATYGNFGEVCFILLANGTEVTRSYTRFFEWDSRTGGGNPTNVAVVSPGAGVTVTFTLSYSGPGTPTNPSTWMAITA
jgi:hypothetical protein